MLFLSSHIPKHCCLTFECQRKTTISTENLTVLMHLDWTELNRTGLDRLDWTFEKKNWLYPRGALISFSVVSIPQLFPDIELSCHLAVGTQRLREDQPWEMSGGLVVKLGPELGALGPSGSWRWHRRLPGPK